MRSSNITFGLFSTLLLSACTPFDLLLLFPGNPGDKFYESVQFVTEGETVEMKSDTGDSTESVDLDHLWNQIDGPAVTLGVLKDGTARFVAPPIRDDRQQLTFRVRIEADDGGVRENTFAVVVEPVSTAN